MRKFYVTAIWCIFYPTLDNKMINHFLPHPSIWAYMTCTIFNYFKDFEWIIFAIIWRKKCLFMLWIFSSSFSKLHWLKCNIIHIVLLGKGHLNASTISLAKHKPSESLVAVKRINVEEWDNKLSYLQVGSSFQLMLIVYWILLVQFPLRMTCIILLTCPMRG